MAKGIKPVRSTPQDIETIIGSFEKYAWTDIQHAKSRPIASFILSICFIEQLSTFIYEFDANNKSKAEWFFSQYMEQYKGIDLYNKARHSLVHNYSSRYEFDIDNRGLFEDVPYKIIDGVININTNVFIGYLEIAFEKAKKTLRDSKNLEGKYTPYNNALKNSLYYPVLVDTAG